MADETAGERVVAMTEAHVDAACSVIDEAYRAHIAGGYTDEGRASFEAYAAPSAVRARLVDHVQFVAVDDGDGGAVVGVAQFREDRHLCMLFVRPAWSRRGIARRLVDAGIAACRGRNPGLAEVTVNASQYAVPAYEAMGFRALGVAHDAGGGVVAVPMVLALSAATPRVREAVLGDERAIAEIHVASWQAAYRGQIADATLDAMSVAEREPVWRRRLTAPARPGQRVWVVEDAEGIAGFAGCGPSRDDDAAVGTSGASVTGEIYLIYLRPDRWRRGLGRALIAHVFAALAAQGFAAVTLWVLAGNAAARRFYEAAGMHVDGAEKAKGHDGHVYDEFRYRIAVGGAGSPATASGVAT